MLFQDFNRNGGESIKKVKKKVHDILGSVSDPFWVSQFKKEENKDASTELESQIERTA